MLFKIAAKKLGWVAAGVATAAGTGLAVALEGSVQASAPTLKPISVPWPHGPLWGTLDKKAIRRGYFVYKQVCAACHSMQVLRYREFVNVFMTEEEAKAEAAEAEMEDGPDDEGHMFMRPGRLADSLPRPYKNDKEAAFKNNGAIPPDLSLMCLSRPGATGFRGGEDYILSLLTGYMDTPAGVHLEEGQAYNPYFPGGVIGMPQQLWDGMLEYEDGTPAVVSQMAKDVATFIKWAGEPYFDDLRLYAARLMVFIPLLFFFSYKWKRTNWVSTEREIASFVPVRSRRPPAP